MDGGDNEKNNFYLFHNPFFSPVFAQETLLNLAEFSLQELAELQVTLVSKKEESLFKADAAIYVITQEDIRRSGVTSIPEALRMVPGLQVARIDANKWAVTARGFIGRFSNKLLVLIDGQSVYTHIFSGVFWDMQDVMLADVDHIEVIRGPGATLWGANAVNGIINIVTKNARDTQNGFVQAGIGTEEKVFSNFRYGGKLSNDMVYRGYLKYFERDHFIFPSDTALDERAGKRAFDGWNSLRGGFRIDWDQTPSNTFMLKGDLHYGEFGHTMETMSIEPPYMGLEDYRGNMAGGDIIFKWQKIFSNASEMTLQTYGDYFKKDEGVIIGTILTYDLEFNYLFDLGRDHQIICGLGYRLIKDHFQNTLMMRVDPDRRYWNLFSGFLQDDYQIIDNRFRVTFGSKIEHNDITGFEIQPNLRLLWTPSTNHTLWAALARAVRTPARGESGSGYIMLRIIQITPTYPTPVMVILRGNPDFKSENLIANEIGYRFYSGDKIFFDLSTFYNTYDHLFSGKFLEEIVMEDPPPQHIEAAAIPVNQIAGYGYGCEVALDWRTCNFWQQKIGYTYTQYNMHVTEGGQDTATVANIEGQCPHHQVYIRSSINLPYRFELDFGLRYVDDLPELKIKSYWNLDCHLSHSPMKNVRISIVGQNLLHKDILEFIPELDYTVHTRSQRGIYGSITINF